MKYCEEYAALLDLFVDGELAPEEMVRVREHLESCSGCRAYVDGALAIRAGFPDVEETVVPEGFAGSVMERIRAASPSAEKRRYRRWIGTAAALAACCVLVVLVRTGTGGGMEPVAMTSMTSGGAPSGYDSGVAEAGIAPQMAEMEESAQISGEPKERTYDTADTTTGNSAVENVKTAGEEQRGILAAAAPGKTGSAAAPPEQRAVADMDDSAEMALCLTAQEAGNLLDGFAPEEENDSERRYTLNLEEYEALLEALGRWEKLPDTPGLSFQVVVTGPF